ncbi:MAG: acyltransferase [Butyrivibrio sp.]|nr:acyltransferase [Butyrivibrio sp.]
METNENRGLYIAKFVACIFVILIHCKFPGAVGDYFEGLSRFGVPMFFAISGWFLLKENDDTPCKIRKRIFPKLIKLVKLTFFMTVIHTAYSFLYAYFVGFSVPELILSKYNLQEFINLVVFNSGRFIYDYTYTFDHLWYLYALIYVYLLVIIFAGFLYKWKRGLIVILLFFLYFGELLQTIYPIRPFDINICTWYVLRNWLFVGVPFTMLGFELRQFDYKTFNLKYKNFPVILIDLGICFTIFEVYVWGVKEVYISSLLIVIGILLLCGIRDFKEKKFERFVYAGREFSGNIYFFHVIIISLVNQFTLALAGNTFFQTIKPFIVIFISLLFAFILAKFKNKNSGRIYEKR